MRFVDSNVFIYVLVRSPKDDYKVAKKILERIEGGEEAVTNVAVIQEIVDWLECNNRREEIEKVKAGVKESAGEGTASAKPSKKAPSRSCCTS